MNRRDSVLLERGSQLDVLDTVLADAGGGHGRLVLVEGAAGAGKTSLLDAACVRAPGRGLGCLRARGTELEQEFPFGLMHQLLGPPIAGMDAGERDGLLTGPLRPAALAVAPDRDLGAAGPPDGVAMWNALALLAAALAARGPLLLCVDDAHWGDASSLRALSFLAGRIAHHPIALVVATRTGEPRAHEDLLDVLRAEPAARRVSVDSLGPAAVASLVRSQLPGADDPACEAAVDATAGNPLYLTELLRAIDRDGDAGEAIRRAALPSLGDQVARRIERVDPAAPGLAKAIAVMGDGATLDSAAALAGLDRATAGPIANRLRRIEVLSAEDPVSFVHPLVRRSVYDAQSTSERDAAHARAAEILGDAGSRPAAVAAHRAAVTPQRSERTARAMVAAGVEATASGALDEAARWYRRALEEDAPEPGRAAILAALGDVEVTMLDPTGMEHLSEALAGDGLDARQRTRASVTLASALSAAGHWVEAGDVIERTQAALGDDDTAAAAELASIGLMIAGYSVAPPGRVPLSEATLDELTADAGWQARGLAGMRAAMALHQGEPLARVHAHLDRALGDGLLLQGHERDESAIANLLVALAELDEHDRGIEVADRLQETGERDGSVVRQFAAAGHRSWILVRRGDLEAASGILTEQLRVGRASGNMSFVAGQIFYAQDLFLERSGMEDLVQFVLGFDIAAAGLTGSIMEVMVHVVRGRLLLAAGRHADAEQELRTALALSTGLRIGPRVAPIRSLLAAALLPAGRTEARELVTAELEEAEAGMLPRPRGIALRAAALVDPDDTAVDRLRESVELFVACGARVEQARTLVALGRHLRRTGSRLDARAELEDAVALARDCGADLLEAQAREELRAAGARPRRDAQSGPKSLTPSELRVARLAADGSTNAQIARSLVLSPKTVETHLTHVYGKLALSGPGARGRLAAALDGSR